MQPHEEAATADYQLIVEKRIVIEKREIDEKLAILRAFCFSPGSPVFRALPLVDRVLLEDQFSFMMGYSAILGQRIARCHGRVLR